LDIDVRHFRLWFPWLFFKKSPLYFECFLRCPDPSVVPLDGKRYRWW
jgi:hypothetical protein